MRPGEVQRWRIIHAGHENNLHIALEKHILHVIAFDGIRRSQVGHFESLLMAPGQRADVLVQAGAIGTYAFRAIANDQGYASPVGTACPDHRGWRTASDAASRHAWCRAASLPSAMKRSPTRGA